MENLEALNNTWYWELVVSLIVNITLLTCLLSPNIVYLIHNKWFDWKKR